MDYAWTGRSPSVIPGFRPSVLPLHEGILDGPFPAGEPLPSEGALTKRFGVTRPRFAMACLSELRASGRSHQGPRHLYGAARLLSSPRLAAPGDCGHEGGKPSVAGAVGSTALGSHFGASL